MWNLFTFTIYIYQFYTYFISPVYASTELAAKVKMFSRYSTCYELQESSL